jgi:hypothetical protein
MPEVLDWSGAEIGKFYRPAKKPVTMRLDTDIVGWLKSYGRGYQTRVNILLRHAMMNSVTRTREKGPIGKPGPQQWQRRAVGESSTGSSWVGSQAPRPCRGKARQERGTLGS